MGSGWVVGVKVGVGEGRMPTGDEGRTVAQVAGVGLEEGLGAGTCDEAGAKVGVEESTAHKVCSVKGGGGARCQETFFSHFSHIFRHLLTLDDIQ